MLLDKDRHEIGTVCCAKDLRDGEFYIHIDGSGNNVVLPIPAQLKLTLARAADVIDQLAAARDQQKDNVESYRQVANENSDKLFELEEKLAVEKTRADQWESRALGVNATLKVRDEDCKELMNRLQIATQELGVMESQYKEATAAFRDAMRFIKRMAKRAERRLPWRG